MLNENRFLGTFRGHNTRTIHAYIQKFILARWPQQLRADFHEMREFRKNILHRQTLIIPKHLLPESVFGLGTDGFF